MTVPPITLHQKIFTQPKGAPQSSFTADSHLQNHHTAWAKAYLLLRFTYNKGLTNPEYKGTQQDLTDEKERLQGYIGLRESR